MTDLAPIYNALAVAAPYEAMLDRVRERLPETAEGAEAFNKSASQLKTTTLDIADLTPTATAKHILASITRTRQALEEASIAVRKKRVELARKEAAFAVTSGFDADELRIDIDELHYQIANIEASARGAIRKLSHLVTQYDAILARLGVGVLTEADYEADQARHHVMTAFFQGLTAARARGGAIDEGNLIYLFQLGINGAVAQAEVTGLLLAEQALLDKGKAPTHAYVLEWLEACANKYGHCPTEYAVARGLVPLDKTSLLT